MDQFKRFALFAFSLLFSCTKYYNEDSVCLNWWRSWTLEEARVKMVQTSGRIKVFQITSSKRWHHSQRHLYTCFPAGFWQKHLEKTVANSLRYLIKILFDDQHYSVNVTKLGLFREVRYWIEKYLLSSNCSLKSYWSVI